MQQQILALAGTILVNIVSNLKTQALNKVLSRLLTQANFQDQFTHVITQVWTRLQAIPAYQQPGQQWLIEVARGELDLWFWEQWLAGRAPTEADLNQQLPAILQTRLPIPPGFITDLHKTYTSLMRENLPQASLQQTIQELAALQTETVLQALEQFQKSLEGVNLQVANSLQHIKDHQEVDGQRIREIHQAMIPPVTPETEFFGRQVQIDLILGTRANRQAVQILGEHQFGKTALLQWLERQLTRDRGPVVYLNPAGMAPKSELAFMDQLLQRTQQTQLMRILHSGDNYAASQTLEQLINHLKGLVILLDDAHKLAVPGHGFTGDFFDMCRSLTQSGKLWWISAATDDLFDLFAKHKLHSTFLNDARKVYLTQLSRNELGDFPFVDEAAREQAYELAGGFPRGLNWLCKKQAVTDPQKLEDELFLELEALFRSWWQRCSKQQQAILRGTQPKEGTLSLLLENRGLLVGVGQGFQLRGRAWSKFIENQND